VVPQYQVRLTRTTEWRGWVTADTPREALALARGGKLTDDDSVIFGEGFFLTATDQHITAELADEHRPRNVDYGGWTPWQAGDRGGGR
jgi:hypothetical protein